MYENSQNWISAISKETLRNNSICILNDDATVRNTTNRDELGKAVFVYVDVEIYNYEINSPKPNEVPEFILTNQWVRCLRVHVLAT